MYNFCAERCSDLPPNSIFFDPIAHLLSVLCVLMKIVSHTSEKKQTKRLKGLKFHTFIGIVQELCESRWTSWAVRPNEPSGFRGRKELLNRASALVATCP